MIKTSAPVVRMLAAVGCWTFAGSSSAWGQGPPCTPAWSSAPGAPGVADGYVADLVPWAHGLGVPELYATGSFTGIGGTPNTGMIARWNGTSWNALGTGLVGQFSNCICDFGGELYVGGYFDSAGGAVGSAKLAKWNGSTWSGVNAGLEGSEDSVWALKSFDDGSGTALYVAGNYTGIAGTDINHLAKFDGTNYTAVGGGTIGGGGIPLIAIELEVWDDGNGPALYVGGRFSSVAGVSASRIAKWDGTTWSGLGTGVTGTVAPTVAVYAIEPWDDGSGPSLFVAGQGISTAGGLPVNRIARWDGKQWHDVGGGVTGTGALIWDLKVFDDGTGEALYAFGTFTSAGGQPANRVAKWNGKTWSAVGNGVGDATVFCAMPFDDGSGDAMFIGGSFTTVNSAPAAAMARYNGCPAVDVPGDTNGDGVVNVDDLIAVILGWGPCPVPPTDCAADVNGSGVVDVDDLIMVILNWG